MRDYYHDPVLSARHPRRLFLIRGAIVLGLVLLFILLSNWLLSDEASLEEQPPEYLSQSLVLPGQQPTPVETPVAPSQEILLEPAVETDPLKWVDYTIHNGDSLASIFKKRGLSASLLHKIVTSSKKAKQLADIKPKQTLQFGYAEDKSLASLKWLRDPLNSLVIELNPEGISAEWHQKQVDVRIASAAGIITSSLFESGIQAGLDDAQIMELAALFGWDIDFALDIREGDAFRVIFEEHYVDGYKFRDGPIIAAEFENRGESFNAYRFIDADGNIAYYDVEGHSKRRAFIRTPIKFARVSSRFTKKRWHPVLKKWRSHKGVDYAAPTGTPIKATGAGKVAFKGWKGGYGRVVILQHGSKYQTVYGHMSKFARLKNGDRVKQGQTIGYVGKSGLATGPHLHYEFRINGVHRNPLTIKLPKAQALAKSKLPQFNEYIAKSRAQLEVLRTQPNIASSEL